jgi:RNase P subunit RPR2
MVREKIFREIKELISKKNSKDNRKAKKLAMRENFKLKELRKEFCQRCFSPFGKTNIRIKNKRKVLICKKCGKIYRFKLN